MYELYVVKVMQEQTLETSDETIGILCKVEKHNSTQNRIRFKNHIAQIGDEIYAITPPEHSSIMQQLKDADEFIAKHQQNNDNEDLQNQQKEQEQLIQDLKQMNDNLAKEKDAIEKQLEDSIDASEHQQLQDEVAELKDLLATSQTKCKYWHDAHNNLIESSDELANRNEELIKQNNDLKNKFDEVNSTNQLLNQNLIATNTNFKETKEQMQSDFEKQEKELKETIEKQQSHIDELTQIKDSLLPLKDNIAQKQHYNEIGALKDEIRTKEKEISKLNNEIESKLASQKSDLSIEHANEKAQILVGFNQQLDNLKLQYNNLANDYNHLLNGVDSLTRINTFFNGKHNEIKKNKEQVPLLEITSEQLPPSDENVLEYVPKED